MDAGVINGIITCWTDAHAVHSSQKRLCCLRRGGGRASRRGGRCPHQIDAAHQCYHNDDGRANEQPADRTLAGALSPIQRGVVFKAGACPTQCCWLSIGQFLLIRSRNYHHAKPGQRLAGCSVRAAWCSAVARRPSIDWQVDVDVQRRASGDIQQRGISSNGVRSGASKGLEGAKMQAGLAGVGMQLNRPHPCFVPSPRQGGFVHAALQHTNEPHSSAGRAGESGGEQEADKVALRGTEGRQCSTSKRTGACMQAPTHDRGRASAQVACSCAADKLPAPKANNSNRKILHGETITFYIFAIKGGSTDGECGHQTESTGC